MTDIKDLLKKLTSCIAPSGCEDNAKELISDLLSDVGDIEIDKMNNISCTFGEGYHIVLEAHLDEIGLIVKDITTDGFIKVASCGGIDERMLLGYEVTVLGKKELNGVISTLPPHLSKDDNANKTSVNDVAIDTGYSFDELKELVDLGDRVIFKRNFTELLSDQISASCLDDRSGVAAVVLAAEEIKKLNLPIKITVLLASQEELGNRGSYSALFGKDVDEVICVDVSFAYTPGCDKIECGEIGKGVMIGKSPILDSTLFNELLRVAKSKDIPYQIEVMNGRTSTDADAFTISGAGFKCSLLSVPEKYMHTPVEVVDINDIISVKNLIVEYAKTKAGVNNA